MTTIQLSEQAKEFALNFIDQKSLPRSYHDIVLGQQVFDSVRGVD